MSRIVTAGIDGSQESLAAADWAAGEAALRSCLLRLVHVWKNVAATGVYAPDPDHERRAAEAVLHEAAEHVRVGHPDLQIETQEKPGAPVELLGEESERSELLVLGSRGLGGVAGFVAGSVSLAVLARVRCPLVLVRSRNAERTAGPPASGGDVVLGLDLPAASTEALAFAFAAADRYRCGVQVVHSWSLPPVYGMGATDVVPTLMRETSAERRKEMAAALAPWTETYPHVPVTRDCRQGHAAQDLVEASSGAACVVVGLRHRDTRLGSHVGPVVHSVLHHTAAPVAVVPHA
ncbi:universal stress protein [Streptomyces sp. NPDC006296]|uniref:universal stress protein n=1 Tax=Streptomyces sp. NPDC006296 TaxID=3156746 RepID=UPI0033A21D56